MVSTFVEIMVCATVKSLPELAVSAEIQPKWKPLALYDPNPKLIRLHLKKNWNMLLLVYSISNACTTQKGGGGLRG